MKFSCAAVLAIAASAIAFPVVSEQQKRAVDGDDFLVLVQDLTAYTKFYTANINSTAASYSALSVLDKPTALTYLSGNASAINNLVVGTTAIVPALASGEPAGNSTTAGTNDLGLALVALLDEINSSLNAAEAATGSST